MENKEAMYRDTAVKKVKRLMYWREATSRSVAKLTGQSHQNYNQKVLSGSMRFWEIIRLADVLDAEVIFVDKKTGKMIV